MSGVNLPERPDAYDPRADIRLVAERRDRAAFARLFAFYAPRVKAYLRHPGIDDTGTEDLAQEVFLIVWRRAHLFDPSQGAPGTWIFTIARNRRTDFLRRGNRPLLDGLDPLLAPEPPVQGDAAFEAEETKERIKAAVAELPPEQADVLRAFFFEDKSHGMIADHFGLPVGTVKSRLRLAIAKLRIVFGQDR